VHRAETDETAAEELLLLDLFELRNLSHEQAKRRAAALALGEDERRRVDDELLRLEVSETTDRAAEDPVGALAKLQELGNDPRFGSDRRVMYLQTVLHVAKLAGDADAFRAAYEELGARIHRDDLRWRAYFEQLANDLRALESR
jgi:hypothetical protein